MYAVADTSLFTVCGCPSDTRDTGSNRVHDAFTTEWMGFGKDNPNLTQASLDENFAMIAMLKECDVSRYLLSFSGRLAQHSEKRTSSPCTSVSFHVTAKS